MDIDKTKCVGCGNCHIICTMGVISLDEDGKSVVNQDECVECGTCYRVLRNEGYRALVRPRHPEGALPVQLGISGRRGPLPDRGAHAPRSCPGREYCGPSSATPPSSIREPASPAGGPTRSRATTSPGGSGRARRVSSSRSAGPGSGAFFRDIEKVAMALAPLEPVFEPENPVTHAD